MLGKMVKRASTRLDAASRRRQILACALPVFARTGCAGTGTRQLAAAAGVSEPILYRHFRSKEHLFAAVLDDTAARLGGALATAMQGAGTVRTRLEALAAALPDLLERHDDDLRVLCGAAAARGEAVIERAVRRAFTAIARVLSSAWAGGGLRRDVSPQAAAFFLLEVGLGAALLRPSGVEAVRRKAFGEQAAALVLAALAPVDAQELRREGRRSPRRARP